MAEETSIYRFDTITNLSPGWTDVSNAQYEDSDYATGEVSGAASNYFRAENPKLKSGKSIIGAREITKVEIGSYCNYIGGWNNNGLYVTPRYDDSLWDEYTVVSNPDLSLPDVWAYRYNDITNDVNAPDTWTPAVLMAFGMRFCVKCWGGDEKFTAGGTAYVDVCLMRVTFIPGGGNIFFMQTF